MNEYAFRHSQRLDFAARTLARDIAAIRQRCARPRAHFFLYSSAVLKYRSARSGSTVAILPGMCLAN